MSLALSHVCPAAGFGFCLNEDVPHKQSKAIAPPPDPDSFDSDDYYGSDDEEPLRLSKMIQILVPRKRHFPKYDAGVMCDSACARNNSEESHYPLEQLSRRSCSNAPVVVTGLFRRLSHCKS